MATAEFAWWPNDQVRADSNWTKFIKSTGSGSYDQLALRVDENPAWFWDQLIKYLRYEFYIPYTKVLDLAEGIQFPKWCVGGTTNLVLNCLDRHAESMSTALVWEGEDGSTRVWTYSDLNRETCRVACGLKSLGVRSGDVVAIYMPMVPETVAAFFAIAKIGAVILPLFSGFGPSAIEARLSDGGAKVVITADGCLRRGQPVAMKAVLDQALEGVTTVRSVVIVPRLGLDIDVRSGRDLWWRDLVANNGLVETERVAAEHPLMIVHTSGTTGKPKGTVHTHCGFGVKTGLDFELCFDLKTSDRLLWMSDMGWLVGPIQVTAAALTGATLVLAEGAPDFPEPDRLWRLVEQHRVSFLGIGPTLARTMRRYGDEALSKRNLGNLRVAASTGEPWDRETWMWVFEKVLRGNGPLMNYSGGTEVGGILATNILFPIKPGSFYGPVLGTGADIVDSDGKPMGVGEVGELVMRSPSIGTTRSLWRDDARYLESYWSKIPGLWVHGDWASRDADGSWFIHGRSDDTIKIAGKRTGPAELEGLLLGTGLLAEAAVVGIPDPVKGAAVVCAVVLLPGVSADRDSTKQLEKAITDGLGKSFKPKTIMFVSDLPKTRNMKVMRRVVRDVLTGAPSGDLSALANPESVEALRAATSVPRA